MKLQGLYMQELYYRDYIYDYVISLLTSVKLLRVLMEQVSESLKGD